MMPPPSSLPKMPLFSTSNGHILSLDTLVTAAAAYHPSSTKSTQVSSKGQAPPLCTPSGYDPIAALPPKLVKRILSLEYVEMAELLPEAWPEENGETVTNMAAPGTRL